MNGRAPQARPGGRHRRGVPATQVHPRQWDATQQDSARRLDQSEPAWIVWYGPGAQRFYAVATWPAPQPLIVQARTADELRDLIREAEHTPPPHQGETMPEAPEDPQQPDNLRAACWDLPHDLPIVGKTRAMVHETLAAWALHGLADDAVLVVGELLANAIIHGEPVVRLCLRASAEEFLVQVSDHGSGQPRHLDLDVEAVHGRGLTIVEALAHDSGVTPLPDRPGKTVWARWCLCPRPAKTLHAHPGAEPRTSA